MASVVPTTSRFSPTKALDLVLCAQILVYGAELLLGYLTFDEPNRGLSFWLLVAFVAIFALLCIVDIVLILLALHKVRDWKQAMSPARIFLIVVVLLLILSYGKVGMWLSTQSEPVDPDLFYLSR